MTPYRLGIVGATGIVGQRLIALLDGHPWFRITALAASSRSAGRPYGEAARWRLAGGPPPAIGTMLVAEAGVDAFDDCDLVLSALDAPVARELEPRLADVGLAVISNASAFRRHPDVPLLVPEVNAEHLALIERQRSAGRSGFIVTNPNCSVAGLAVAVAPIERAFGVRRIVVATMQAVSGAGIDGPTALELVDNVLPSIPGEEDKLEHELARILGHVGADGVEPAACAVSAHCHRVPVLDGHLEAVSLETERPATPEAVVEAMRAFRGSAAADDLPSSGTALLAVSDDPMRPQPRLDRDAGDGMTVTVGRVRACPVFGIKFVVLSHNAVRGAAGGTLVNAELLAARGLLPRRGAS